MTKHVHKHSYYYGANAKTECRSLAQLPIVTSSDPMKPVGERKGNREVKFHPNRSHNCCLHWTLHYCCLCSYMNDFQHWRLVSVLIDWLIDWLRLKRIPRLASALYILTNPAFWKSMVRREKLELIWQNKGPTAPNTSLSFHFPRHTHDW